MSLKFLIVVESDSESAFSVMQNFLLKICFCFVVIAFFFVCFSDLMHPTFCFWGVISFVSLVLHKLNVEYYDLFVS